MINLLNMFVRNKYICNYQRMYNNGVPHLQSLSKLKQQYDAIFQENSSFRQSLLVSPYCSKFEKQQSPRQSIRNNGVSLGNDNSLLEYIRPFESQQLNKTETKQKMRKRLAYDYDNRKKTEPDFDDHNMCRQENSERTVNQLKQIIKQKDDRILWLQKNLAEFGFKKGQTTQQTINGSPQIAARSSKVSGNQNHLQRIRRTQREKKQESSQIGKQNYMYYETQLANYKKEVRFLTCNNQQMFEEIRKINSYCEKLKKTLNSTLLYVKDLQQKLMEISQKNQQLEYLNEALILQKKEMMSNYEEELELFKKMRKIWQQQQNNKIILQSNSQSKQKIKATSKQKSGRTLSIHPKFHNK